MKRNSVILSVDTTSVFLLFFLVTFIASSNYQSESKVLQYLDMHKFGAYKVVQLWKALSVVGRIMVVGLFCFMAYQPL